ncbi:MAG: acylneuraminate cytidylyltransferase family protein [Bacteroidales bacterium]|nr:acylneuraminate cytidylyltransferase family protein [Bacteroidales bacterium]MDD6141838.1 acylneuraminate cytidylyltransferase family protein [Bacteroidales bacterium]MDD6670030.1 acylneuraminate cytidylyltransferase family protein [Bacteroidales bacterium]
MKTLYVIPARGGSKGIPHKNIKPLAGKPLIGYSIDVARQLADDADICLTTDDPEIARTAESMGLNVPFLRPASLATDTCGTYEVLIHALDFYRDRGIDYDTLVLLQPTSPMRTADDVRAALELYSPDIDMVVTVKEAASNPYYNCYETDSDGFLHISKGDGGYTRRQDAPKVWEYNGAVYVINVESLRQMPLSAFTRRRMSVMPAERSVDLDTPIDWLIAEKLIENSKQ